MMHRFKLLANGFGILLGAGAAHADEVVIRLGNETQLAPSHLCVASQTIRDLLPEERAGQKPNSECGRGAGQQRGSECAPGLSGAFQFVETRTPDGVTGVGLVQGLLASAAKSSRTNPMASAKTACGDWRPTDGELNVEMRSCELPRRAACDVVSVAAGQLAKDQALSCRANTQLSGARGRLGVAILDFQQAHIQGFSLTGHVARIRLEPTRAELEALPIIKVVGGTYLQSAEVPLREITGTDLVELPLVPRCSEQHIAMPSYECPAALDSAGDDIVIVRTGTSDLQVSREWLAHSPVLDIPNVSASMSQLTLLACFDPNKKVQRLEDAFAHELVARWHPADPPEPRQMVPNRLQFFWARDGLVNEDECPAAPELVERGVKCSRLEGARASSTCAYENARAGSSCRPSCSSLERGRGAFRRKITPRRRRCGSWRSLVRVKRCTASCRPRRPS